MSKQLEQEVINTVDNLNEILHGKDGNKYENNTWSYASNGYVFFILFDSIQVWDSETEGRIFNENTNSYNDLTIFCTNELRNYIRSIQQMIDIQ